MIDEQGYEFQLRERVSLERLLEETGETNVSREIESQMMFARDRAMAHIKQAHHHAADTFRALRMVLKESNKPETDA